MSAVTTAVLFAWLLYYSGYGLSLGNEGFHLNSIANPFAYAINVPPTLFGFLYHWPYQWVGGDIAALRMANVTLTMALGWALSFLTIRRLWTVDWPSAAVLSAGMASLTLVAFYRCWLLTPSYFSLNIQSASIVMIGLLLADQRGRIRQVCAWILVGIGGWCCFMARPATAAGSALLVMFYVVVLGRKSLLPMLAAALLALALLIGTAYLIGGGIAALVTRMVNGIEGMALMGDGHEMSRVLRIDWPPITRSQLVIAFLAATALLLSILVGTAHKFLTTLALAAVLIATIAIVLLGSEPISVEPLTLFLVPAITWLGVIFYREGSVLRTQTPTSTAVALAFLVLPHLLALSSNVNYWEIGSLAALFWMLAVVAFLCPLAKERRSVATLLPLTVLAQLLTASIVNAGMLRPWAQMKNLRAYNAVTAMPGGGKLVLSQPVHDYLTQAAAEARAAGFEFGTSVVDLSNSPTLLYVLEARALGQPWLIGGQPGSNEVAVKALGLENCADLVKAWLLVAPDGPRHLDQASVVASFGAERDDYIVAATFEAPAIDGYYPKAHRRFLLKPARPAGLAEQSCHDTRRQRPADQKWSHS
ncbi:hypothetical protein BE61_01780 [Bradyrhizobium elkanii USDA 61]|nr:hypothetical protein BE61_01780 [Bradyrhizobium elkanii USDA 61]